MPLTGARSITRIRSVILFDVYGTALLYCLFLEDFLLGHLCGTAVYETWQEKITPLRYSCV